MKKNLCLISLFFILYNGTAQQPHYTNPILGGFYPDPSICKVDADYYLTTSSFAYFPGLPIFHSRDLVNWKQIGHAMNRPEQLNLDSAGVSRGLFAPTIRFHKGVFYIICTLVDKLGNFVITATNPAGPWSNPVALHAINGIDPSVFFDDDDRAYIAYNSIPPENVPLYNGHRTIRMYEFDWKNLKVKGDEKILVNGGTDLSKKPVWIEAPHQFKKDGWYYLICAEGGTAYDHSEVVFRSKSVEGPYIPWDKNPILTQRHLDPNRRNPVTSTGHADFTQAPDGSWWAVFLGCRPYTGEHYNTGRETFMAPVHWKEGWPVILEGNETVALNYPVPLITTKQVNNPFSGSFTFKDEFINPQLNDRWIFLRTVREYWYNLTEKKGALALRLRPETLQGKGNPSFVAHRQQHLSGEASTSVFFTPSSSEEKSGLVIFQNEKHYYLLCKSVKNNNPVIEVYEGPGEKDSIPVLLASYLLKSNKTVLDLKISFDKEDYMFWYKEGKGSWNQLLNEPVSGKWLSTSTAGGFVGTVFALYATSSGKISQAKAFFNWFQYKGDDNRHP